MQEIIIDGCNLAYKAYGGAGEKERADLLRRLKSYYFRKKIRVTIVFDSSEGDDVLRVCDNLKVRYATTPADNHIIKLVRESKRPASLTVITDDRSVGHHVRSLGAHLTGSLEFLVKWKGWRKAGGSVPSDKEKPSSETLEQIKRYLDLWE